MRTKYFQTIRLSDAGKERFRALASMQEEAREALVQWLSGLEALPRLYTPTVEKIAGATDVPADVVADAIKIALDALGDLGEFGDSAEDFVADARAAKLLEDEAQYSRLEAFLVSTLPHAKRLHVLSRVAMTEDRGAPLLRRTSSSAVIKPVFQRDFEYGKTKITDYNPSVVHYTVVGQVELLLQNQVESLAFQVSEDTLDRFVSDLLALQAEMKCARSIADSRLSEKKEGK